MIEERKLVADIVQRNQTRMFAAKRLDVKQGHPELYECGPRFEPPVGPPPVTLPRSTSSDEPTIDSPSLSEDTASNSLASISSSSSTSTQSASPKAPDSCALLEKCQSEALLLREGRSAQKAHLDKLERDYELVQKALRQCVPIRPHHSKRGCNGPQKEQWGDHITECNELLREVRYYKDWQFARLDEIQRASLTKRDNGTLDNGTLASSASWSSSSRRSDLDDTKVKRTMVKRLDRCVEDRDAELKSCQSDLQNEWRESESTFDAITTKYKDLGNARERGPVLKPLPKPSSPPPTSGAYLQVDRREAVSK